MRDPSPAAATPTIEVTPRAALADEPLRIRLFGLPPRRPVTVRASMPGGPGHRWQSHATFEADGRGIVDVSSRAPLDGTYDEADP